MVLPVDVATDFYGRLELEQDGLGHEDFAGADAPARGHAVAAARSSSRRHRRDHAFCTECCSIRISLSSSATCLPGRSPRTLSSFSRTASTASVLEVAIWAMALVCGASRARYSRLQVAAATLHLRGYELYTAAVLSGRPALRCGIAGGLLRRSTSVPRVPAVRRAVAAHAQATTSKSSRYWYDAA